MESFVLSGFGDEISTDLETQMRVLRENGIYHIEIRGVNGKNVVDYSLDDIKEIKNQLDLNEIKVSAIGSPIGKISITDEFGPHLEKFKHTLNIAKILETKYIRMFSFFIPANENPEMYFDEVVNRWRLFIDVAKDYNIVLLHENEKDIYGDTPERCLKLLQALNCDYVKLTFDPANFVQCNCRPYSDCYDLLSDYIDYIHIKDANATTHEVVPSGYGDGQIKENLTDLYHKGYKGFLSIEPHLGYFEGLNQLEIDDKWKSLPKGGEQLFTVATEALKQLLGSILD